MEKKYEFTGNKKVIFTPNRKVTLYQIRSLKDFSNVRIGDIGGWIESEFNLSHDGNCWVYRDSWVYDSASICDNAKVKGFCRVCGNAKVYNEAEVSSTDYFTKTLVDEYAVICGDTKICNSVIHSGILYHNVIDNDGFERKELNYAYPINPADITYKKIFDKKYEITNEVKYIKHNNIVITLHHIKALKDFDIVRFHHCIKTIKAGDLGGWIESEDNLSQRGNCWVDSEAMIYGNAKVTDDVYINGDVKIHDNVKISDSVYIDGKVNIHDDSEICDDVVIDTLKMFDENDFLIEGSNNIIEIYGNAKISGDVVISGNINIKDCATVRGDTRLLGNIEICDTAGIYNETRLTGYIKACGDALIYCDDIENLDSEHYKIIQ